MNNLNSILIEGNIVDKPKIYTTPKGTQVCNFKIASNRFHKDEIGFHQETSYFKVETWAKLAEQCYDKGKPGRGCRVVGRLKQERYVDSSGKQRAVIKIVAEMVEFRPEFKKPKEKNPGFEI